MVASSLAAKSALGRAYSSMADAFAGTCSDEKLEISETVMSGRLAREQWIRMQHVALVVAGREEAQRALGRALALALAQHHGIEARALQQRHHVDDDLAGGADLARVAQARAQHVGLRIGAAVDPLRELERDQRDARQVGL